MFMLLKGLIKLKGLLLCGPPQEGLEGRHSSNKWYKVPLIILVDIVT
jgi:hypothetical protein